MTVPSGTVFAADSRRPAAVKNATYKFKSNVKQLPNGTKYNLKPMDISEIKNNKTGTDGSKSGSGSTGSTQLKYPLDSKQMILDKTATAFKPKKGEIYVDQAGKSLIKVIGTPYNDSIGNRIVPITEPDFNEVFEYYKIPKQTLALNSSNVTYIAPEVQMIDSSASSGSTSGNSKSKSSTNDITFKLPRGVVLYDSTKDAEEQAQQAAGDQTLESKEEEDPTDYDNLEGISDTEEINVKVWIEKDSFITLKNPTFSPEVDLGIISQSVSLNFNADVEADITVKASLNFHKVIEKCVYGYDIEVPFGKAYVGIFVVVDIAGNVQVQVRTITKGKAETGITGKAIGLVPIVVYPTGNFIPSTFDMGFSVNGTITAKAGVVPQAGLKIGKLRFGLQIWAGIKATAKFSGQAGTSNEVGGPAYLEGSLKIEAFAELAGFFLGTRYSILYLPFTLYEGSFSTGQEVSAGSGNVKQLQARVNLGADAFANCVMGRVQYSDENQEDSGYISYGQNDSWTSYVGGDIKIYVQHSNGLIDEPYTVNSNQWGKFILENIPIAISDKIWVALDKHITGEGDIHCQSAPITPSVGAIGNLQFNPDAFNDVVTGTLPGLDSYNGPVRILVSRNSSEQTINGNIVNGKLSVPAVLVGGSKVKVEIPFDGGASIFVSPEKDANLDSLVLGYEQPRGTELKLNGSVQNLNGPYKRPYTGIVTLSCGKTLTTQAQPYYEKKLTVDSNGKFITKSICTSSSTFSFPVAPLKFTLSIEHDGMIKQVSYDPVGDVEKQANRPLQLDVIYQIDRRVDPIINPVDFMQIMLKDTANSAQNSGINAGKGPSNMPSDATTTQQNLPWSGVWETDSGGMVLTQSGSNITGIYNNCSLKGTVSGNNLKGSFITSNKEIGEFELILNGDGKGFRGRMRYTDDKDWSNWEGVWISKLITTQNKSEWSGIWFTDWGVVVLKQDGDKVSGICGENMTINSIQGTVSGSTLKGKCFYKDSTVDIEFKMYTDGMSFTGQYRYKDEDNWSAWNGVRKK